MNTENREPEGPDYEPSECTQLHCGCIFDVDGNWHLICNGHQGALDNYLRLAKAVFKMQVLGEDEKGTCQ